MHSPTVDYHRPLVSCIPPQVESVQEFERIKESAALLKATTSYLFLDIYSTVKRLGPRGLKVQITIG